MAWFTWKRKGSPIQWIFISLPSITDLMHLKLVVDMEAIES
jgi:hypothetical protein